MKYSFLFCSVCIVFFFTELQSARELTLEKIWLKGTFSPNYVHGLKSMKDGINYTVLDEDEGVQKINVYDYELGKLRKNLLTNNLKNEDGSPMNIEGYELSADESKILLKSQSERIYRYSMRSAYYVYDIATAKLTRIGSGKFQLAGFSPDGKFVSYVRENNLYVFDLTGGVETAITTDGTKNSIINGAPDWVYEEEFALVKAYEWSPDSKCIAYYRIDESRVKEFSFPVYGSLYPENYIYKYQKFLSR